jgi:hypothetical protein
MAVSFSALRHDRKTFGRLEVELRVFSTSTLNGGGWLISCPSRVLFQRTGLLRRLGESQGWVGRGGEWKSPSFPESNHRSLSRSHCNMLPWLKQKILRTFGVHYFSSCLRGPSEKCLQFSNAEVKYALCSVQNCIYQYTERWVKSFRKHRNELVNNLWNWVLLDKLIVCQIVKKFPIFYGTRWSITVFTRSGHWSLSEID